jgi:hypothetical protein
MEGETAETREQIWHTHHRLGVLLSCMRAADAPDFHMAIGEATL